MWVNSTKTYNMLYQVEKTNYEVEILKESILYLKSSPEGIVCVVQKVLIASKTKQKITPDHSPECYGNLVHMH